MSPARHDMLCPVTSPQMVMQPTLRQLREASGARTSPLKNQAHGTIKSLSSEEAGSLLAMTAARPSHHRTAKPDHSPSLQRTRPDGIFVPKADSSMSASITFAS